jgi:carbonic anhydrase
LVSQNVVAQLANLTTHPSVAAALAQQAVALHGWIYDIGTGTVSQLDPVTNEFIAISSERPPSKSSARTTSAVGFAPAEPV